MLIPKFAMQFICSFDNKNVLGKAVHINDVDGRIKVLKWGDFQTLIRTGR
jgi:hypothetical protein